ncbi:MAG: TonB-dependent siderophore receptor [Pseudomonadota bacterium]
MFQHPRPTHIAAAVMLLLNGAAAFAQGTPETTLEEVKVIGKAEASYAVKSTLSATRTDTLLRDTPQAITVITKELMRDQAMQSMADVIRYVPGIVTAQGEGNRDTAVFRGNSSTGDFYVDGIRDDVQYYRDFYNIDSVEALKGSNAMIFGRGGSGGVINRVSKQPEWTPVREASLTLGSWNNRRVTADVGQPISTNVALRVNAMVEDSDSYRNHVNVQRKGINPTLAIRAGANTSVALGFEHFKDERVADRGVSSYQGRPVRTSPGAFFGNPELSLATARMNAVTAFIEHDFGAGLTLRNRSRFADYDKFYQNVFASTVSADGVNLNLGGYNNATQRTNLFNQTDLNYLLDAGGFRHKLLAGIELGRQETDNLRNTGYFNNATSTSVPIANPVYSGVVTFRPAASDASNHSVSSVASAYVQDQLELSPRWQIVAGVRIDRFSVDFHNNRDASDIKVTDSPLAPRVGLVFKPVTAMSLYGSYSIAYVPRAGDQLSSLTASNKTFEPEQFKNLELGFKWDVLPNLAATAAVYKLNRSNVAVTSSATTTELVDGQRSKGVELGLAGNITPAWSVMGGYAYQDATITKDLSATVKAGTVLAQVPTHALSLWNRHAFSPNWAVALGVVYRDSIYTSTSNTVTLPAFTRIDGALFYTISKQYKVQVNVENLFDKRYYASANSDSNITPGSPRALRMTLNAKL